MEKERTTILEYYASLFALLRGERNDFIISTEDIYRETKNLNDQLGLKTTAQSLWGTKKTFLKLFAKYIVETVVDKGRGNKELFSIAIKPSDVVGLEVKLGKAFPRLNRVLSSKMFKEAPKKDLSKTTEKKVKVSIKKPKSVIPGRKMPRRDWLFKFYELLKIANISDGNKVTKKQILSTMSLKHIPSMSGLINAWSSTLVRGGLVAHFSLYKNLKGETDLVISDCPSLIKSLGEKYKEWFDVDLKAEEVLNIATSIPVERVFIQPKLSADLPYPVAYTIFAIGGICRDRGSMVSYDVLYKLLKDMFSIKTSKSEIIELVRREASEYLENSNNGAGGVKLKNTVDWDKFVDRYSPRNFKESVYARIGMTLEEVKKLIPDFEVEIVTEFTANDIIYRIDYDKSIHSLKSLCVLYRTFRGSDKFFDEELTKQLKKEIDFIDSRSYVGNLAFEIEC